MTTPNTTANRDTLQKLFEAFNQHDLEKVLSLMTDDIVFEGAAGTESYGTRFIGQEAVGQAFAGVWAIFSDVRWENHTHFVSEGLGLSEWTLVGTREDGARIEADGVDLFTFVDGKIASKKAFRKDRPLLVV